MTTGDAGDGRAGHIMLTVGSGHKGAAGNVSISSAQTMDMSTVVGTASTTGRPRVRHHRRERAGHVGHL